MRLWDGVSSARSAVQIQVCDVRGYEMRCFSCACNSTIAPSGCLPYTTSDGSPPGAASAPLHASAGTQALGACSHLFIISAEMMGKIAEVLAISMWTTFQGPCHQVMRVLHVGTRFSLAKGFRITISNSCMRFHGIGTSCSISFWPFFAKP